VVWCAGDVKTVMEMETGQSAAPRGWKLRRGGWALLAAVLSSPVGAGSPRQHVAPLASQTVYRPAAVPYGGAANDAIDLT
jgi:hypothetical protein